MKRALVTVLAGIVVLVLAGLAAAGNSTTTQPVGDQPHFTTDGSAPFGFRSARTIPNWSSTFTTDGVTYTYTMVGTAPSSGTTTTVPVYVIPLKLNFTAQAQALASRVAPACVFGPDGVTTIPGSCVALNKSYDGGSKVSALLASPIFDHETYTQTGDSGVQYGDAIQRAEFNKVGSLWHTELGTPVVEPTVSIDVPQNQGVAYVNRRGVDMGKADSHWLSNQFTQLINQFHIPANALPIIQTDNVYLYDANDPNNCCTLGYHAVYATRDGNGAQQTQTFIYAAYAKSGALSNPMIADIHPLSHEVSEWMNDPFVWNFVPPWTTGDPFYGCTSVLETGDPVVGVGWLQNGYHPEDEALLSWFARESPATTSYGGLYTFNNTFHTVPNTC
jgi:hypothetical protein